MSSGVAFLYFVLLVLTTITTADNFQLSGSLIGIDVSPSMARISLDAGAQIAIPLKNGKFYFHNLSIGEHSLEIHLAGYEWYNYMIDVRSNGKIRKFKSQKKDPESPKFVIAPIKKAQYVLPPKPWNPLNFFKSGPGLMIGIMLVTTIVMPKMMEAAGNQQQAALAEEQKAQQQQQQSLTNSNRN